MKTESLIRARAELLEEIAQLQAAVGELDRVLARTAQKTQFRGPGRPPKAQTQVPTRNWAPGARKAASARMKAYWAARREKALKGPDAGAPPS